MDIRDESQNQQALIAYKQAIQHAFGDVSDALIGYQKFHEVRERQGPVEVGEAVLTTGGNLAATHVIHAAVMGPDLKTDGEHIAATTRAVLALAAKHRITSLALPALGTGVGHVPPGVCANAMLNAVVSHLKGSPTGLKRVVFVLYQDDAYKAFTDTLKRLGGVQ